jgi:hypothetical protein
MEETKGLDLEKKVDEIRHVVLELQRFLTAPGDVVAVRSCTSCLSDSCNKPLTAQTPTG